MNFERFSFLQLKAIVSLMLFFVCSDGRGTNFKDCLDLVYSSIRNPQLNPCVIEFDQAESTPFDSTKPYKKQDLTSKETRLLKKLKSKFQRSKNPDLKLYEFLRDARLNPDKYSEAFLTMLFKDLGENEKLAASLVKANKSLNQVQSLAESIGRSDTNLTIETGYSTMKQRLQKLKADLDINIKSTYKGFFRDSPTMRREDIVEAKSLISEIDHEIDLLDKYKARSDDEKLAILDKRFKKFGKLKQKFIESDKKSLGASEDFQERVGTISTVNDVISTLAQSTSVQIATLTGGPAGGAAMAGAFCIFQKEYTRLSLSDGKKKKTPEEISRFHQDVVKSCAIEGATAAAAGKVSLSAMDKIDSKVASKAMSSVLKVLSTSGINIASSTSSTVLTNLFASSASHDPSADTCRIVAQSIKAEISQYTTPKGVGIVLLQSLIFKKLHQMHRAAISPKPILTDKPKSRMKVPETYEELRSHIDHVISSEKQRRASRSTTAANKEVMDRWGLESDQYVYRYVDPSFVDMKSKRARGNPESVARLTDDHSPNGVGVNMLFSDHYVREDTFSAMRTMIESSSFDDNSIRTTKSVWAKDIGPGLNVSSKPIEGYNSDGHVLIRFRLKDALRLGGRLYKDNGNQGGGHTAFWVEVPDAPDGSPQSVPIEIIE